jgi:uncharacterized membrane protein YdjX (TVP38/TMEM64 family)
VTVVEFHPGGLHRAARLLLLISLGLGGIAAWRWRAALDPMTLTTTVGRYPVAPLVFLGMHVAASLLFIPRTALAIVAGLLFGIGWGIFWAEIGSVAGAAAGFIAARYMSSGGLVGLERNPSFRPMLERVERGGWRAVALFRLIPIMPHSIANYGLGLTRLPLGAYLFGSLIGQLPMTVAYVDLGAAGGKLMLGGAGWIDPTLIGLAALSLTLLFPAYYRWRAR